MPSWPRPCATCTIPSRSTRCSSCPGREGRSRRPARRPTPSTSASGRWRNGPSTTSRRPVEGPARCPARRELASTIVQESHRMGRLVANLLDMIRVEAGTLQVQKEWQLLSEAVGVALLRTEDQLRDHPVTTSFPPDLPLVAVDEILLEQVFVNLLENAAKHTPPGTP